MGFEVSEAQVRLTGFLFLLPAYLEVELSATSLVPYLPAWYHASHYDDNELNHETASKPQLNVFFYKVAMVVMSLHNNIRLTKTNLHVQLYVEISS